MTEKMKILERVANEKVEWKRLGEVCEIKNGYTPSKKKEEYWTNGTIPWFRLEDIRLNGRMLFDAIQKVTEGAVKKELFEKDSIILSTTATVGVASIVRVPFLCNQQLTAITTKDKDKLKIEYLYYYLTNSEKELFSLANSSGGIKIIPTSNLKELLIPIPSLETQGEIVRILDTFTSYIDEITKERDLREKQYNYYLDMMLSLEYLKKISNKFYPNGDFEIVEDKLENLFEIRNGYTPSKRNEEYWSNGTVNWFRMDDIRENGKILESSLQKVNEIGVKGGKLFPKNSIIISTSATIGEHALITEPFLANQRFTVLSPKESWKEKINMKYMFYYSFLLSEFCLKNLTKSSFASVDMDKFKSFKILLPPLEVQKHVVDILDKFYTISNDLKEGLPYEIELRQKQYEYYREKLLDFKK